MDHTANINLENIEYLCRICLTRSKTMILLTTVLNDKIKGSPTISHALEMVMSVSMIEDNRFPSVVCPMCLGLLKISYDLKLQFDKTCGLLKQCFNDLVFLQDESNNTKLTAIRDKDNRRNKVSVELIVGKNKYDINDVVIVEDDSMNQVDFKGFLQNLGNTISAQFVDKSYKYHPKLPNDENSVVIIEKSNRSAESSENELSPKVHTYKGRETEDASEIDQYILSHNSDLPTPQKATVDIDEWNLEDQSDKDREVIQSALNVYYQCENCQKFYSIKGRYLKHIESCSRVQLAVDQNDSSEDLSVTASDALACSYCSKTFSFRKQLNAHVIRAHGKGEKTYKCPLCEHVSYSRSALVYHKLKHNEKKFTCMVCDKKFYTKNIMKAHVLNHQNITQVLCPVCGKSFHYKSGLVYHMKIHTNERNYCCTYCDRRFYMLNSLKRHMRTHTGIRPYTCSFCEKSFFSKGEVSKHEMLHTGYRPHRCLYCKKGFTSKFNLNVHCMAHPGPHKCEICDKTFIETIYLKNHMKNKHNFSQEDSNVHF